MATGASHEQARDFAADLRALLEWVHAPSGGARNEVVALVQETLGTTGADRSVVARELPAFEHVNLQTALDAWSGLRYFGPEIRSFADTAALACEMDLVVSVCTSGAHLAGALGRPLWVLLGFRADWRWLLLASASWPGRQSAAPTSPTCCRA